MKKCTLLVIMVVVGAGASIQGHPLGDVASRDEIIEKLKTEARKVQAGEISETIASMIKKDRAWSRSLTGEQEETARLLDAAGRAVVRAWLLRGLDGGSTPGDLASRLSEGGDKVRARIIAHADAIACEGILERAVPPKGGVSKSQALGLSVGRYGHISSPEDGMPESAKDAEFIIQASASNVVNPQNDFSGLFGVVLARGHSKSLALSPEQEETARLLDAAGRAVVRAWLLRGLDGGRLPDPATSPPTPRMLGRLSDYGERVRASMVAHFETILLESVLSPEQAERAKRSFWRRRGLRSLLDPELADRIDLKKSQKLDLSEAFESRASILHHSSGAVAALTWGDGPVNGGGENRAEREALAEQFKIPVAEADATILNILTARQIKLLNNILKDRSPDQEPKQRPPG